jgi:glycosyltransferase involved in cell wall biosynthesis
MDTRTATGATVAERPLTICVIGQASSGHVVVRARCFADRGHRVLFVTPQASSAGIRGVTEHGPGLESSPARDAARRLVAPGLRALGLLPPRLFQLLSLIRFLQKHRPDIVHVHYAHGYYGWFAALIGCRPLVVTVMGGDILFEEQGSPTPLTRWLTVELLRQADYITSKSHYLTSVMDRLGGFGPKTERIVWGVSLDRFRRIEASALRARLGIAAGRRIILSPRILQPFYRVHLLVEALPRVVRQFPEALLLITEHVADPAYRAAIAARVAELGLGGHVLFCGEAGQETMPLLYSAAEVSIGVPSSDGLPQTLLEAMACETPNVLSRLPRYEELVRHEESAYFVDPTPEGIAAGVTRLLGDAGLRERISRNALAIVRAEADLDEQVRRVERRYRELSATVPRRAFSLSRMWSAWRAFRRFRRSTAAAG